MYIRRGDAVRPKTRVDGRGDVPREHAGRGEDSTEKEREKRGEERERERGGEGERLNEGDALGRGRLHASLRRRRIVPQPATRRRVGATVSISACPEPVEDGHGRSIGGVIVRPPRLGTNKMVS